MTEPGPEQPEDAGKKGSERLHAEKLRLAFIKAGIADGSRVVSNLVLINGAAAISIMTFVGSVATSRHVSKAQFSLIWWGLLCFVVGVGAATLTAGLSYWTNSKFGEAWAKRSRGEIGEARKDDRRAYRRLYWAVAFALVSLGCFAVGVWLVSSGVAALLVSVPEPPAPE